MNARLARLLAPWRSPAGLVAAVLVLAQAVWRGAYLLPGYYAQDDFRMIALGGSSRLDLDYLFQSYSGHLWPGDFLVAWVTARVDPTSWTLTALFLLALQACSGMLFWLVVTRVVGPRWRRIPVLAVFLFAPLTLWSLQWYAQAIGYLPVTLFLLVAVWALLRRVQDGWRAGAVVVVAATAAALMFQERALLVPVVLGGVAVMAAPAARPLARIRAALTAHAAMWAALAVVLVGYLVLHDRLAPIEAGVPDGSATSPGTLARDFVVRSLLPGLAGGPWQAEVTGELVVPATWAVVVGAVVAALVVGVTLWRGGSWARWGWAMLAVYVACDIVILFGGRTQYDFAFGLFPRYIADVVPVAAIALAAAVRDTELPGPGRVPWLRPVPAAAVAGAVTLAYVASAAVSTTLLAPERQHREVRAYVETLRGEIRENPRVVLYDAYVPGEVMIGLFEDERRVSTVLAEAPENPVYDLPSGALRIPDEKGRLREVRLAFGSQMRPSDNEDCGYPVSAQEVTVPLKEPVEADRYVMRIGYFTNVRTLMTAVVAGEEHRFPVRRGLNLVDVVVSGTFDDVRLTIDASPGTVCVAGLEVGFPVPVEPGGDGDDSGDERDGAVDAGAS
jgi:hypothetical protein